jgi:carbamoyl-phosphate synthase large subunit
MNKKINILVTGVGAIIGYGIIESLRTTSIDCNVIGTDINEENYGKYICDTFIKVPYTSNPDYGTIIDGIINKYHIEIIFPGIEQDVFFFSSCRESIKAAIVLNNPELINLSKDKFLMYNFLKKNEFENLIPTYENLSHESAVSLLDLPYIIKPKYSYASKGFHIIDSDETYNKFKEVINSNTLFQPYIGSNDEEYTVSVFGDGNGSYIDSYILRRYLSSAGASDKVFSIKHDIAIEKSVNEIVKIFKPVGPTNMQFRKSANKVFLLEINPRISSACSLRTKFGYNEPLYCLQHYIFSKQYLPTEKKFGKAIRYISDKVIYE